MGVEGDGEAEWGAGGPLPVGGRWSQVKRARALLTMGFRYDYFRTVLLLAKV